MAILLKESRTKDNLMRAFAGESQARNRYTIAAEQAGKSGLYSVQQIFLFTAEQERAHAERFYELLKPLTGTTIHVDGTYPVDGQDSVIELLMAAHHNEYEEYEDVYPKFGDQAKAEGFFEIASAFYQIAEIEKIHGDRFHKVAEMLKKGTYTDTPKDERWMCLNCGHIYTGRKVPKYCPVCRHERGYFIPLSLAPYTDLEGWK